MSFSVPTFNLTAGIWTGNNALPTTPPRLTSPCNLAIGRSSRAYEFRNFTIVRRDRGLSLISPAFFPAGTDIRDDSCSTGFDLVELPLGSSRWYWVTFVDDVAKGFSNEHRLAVLQKVYNYQGFFTLVPQWPTPIP